MKNYNFTAQIQTIPSDKVLGKASRRFNLARFHVNGFDPAHDLSIYVAQDRTSEGDLYGVWMVEKKARYINDPAIVGPIFELPIDATRSYLFQCVPKTDPALLIDDTPTGPSSTGQSGSGTSSAQ